MLGKLLGKDGAVLEAEQACLSSSLGAEILREESANYYGLASKGGAQIRGDVCLILSEQGLVSTMWMPRATTVIPTAAFIAVSEVRSHAGKARLSPVVRLQFRTESGEEDSAAWLVRDKEAWLAALGRFCAS